MFLFSVVIPTYNNLEELKNCLASFENQTIKDFEIIVCVDGSTDGTIEYLTSSIFSFRIRIFEHKDKKNHGRATTRNLVLNKLNSKFVLFIDSDTTATHNLIEEHYNLLQNQTKIISLGSIFYTNEKKNLVAYYLNQRGKNNNKHLDELIPQYFTTQNFALSVDDFNYTQGFDEIYDQSYGGEDTEYAIRITKNFGYKIINNNKAIVYSIMDKTPEKLLIQMHNFGYTNLNLLIKTYPEYNIFKTNFMLKHSLILTLSVTIYNLLKSVVFKPIISFKSLSNKYKYPIFHLMIWLEILRGFKLNLIDKANKNGIA